MGKSKKLNLGIGKGISDAIRTLYNRNEDGTINYDAALKHIFPALDETAGEVYPHLSGEGHVGQRIKLFIRDNSTFITGFTFVGSSITGAIRVVFNHPKLKPDAAGTVAFEDLLYLIRNGLIHHSQTPETIIWEDQTIMKMNFGNTITLPKTLPFGLTMAVVAAVPNKGQTFRGKMPSFNFGTTKVEYKDELWGDAARMTDLLKKIKQENTPAPANPPGNPPATP